MSKVYVKPAEGRTVLLPRTTPGAAYGRVPDVGMWLDNDVFLWRRLHHRDLVECDPPANAPASDQTPQAVSAPAAAAPVAEPAATAPVAEPAAQPAVEESTQTNSAPSEAPTETGSEGA